MRNEIIFVYLYLQRTPFPRKRGGGTSHYTRSMRRIHFIPYTAFFFFFIYATSRHFRFFEYDRSIVVNLYKFIRHVFNGLYI